MLSVSNLMQEAYPDRTVRRGRTAADREEERRRLDLALQELPETMRLALALRFEEGLRLAQVASVLGSSEPEIRQLLTEAVQALAEILRRDEGTREVDRETLDRGKAKSASRKMR